MHFFRILNTINHTRQNFRQIRRLRENFDKKGHLWCTAYALSLVENVSNFFMAICRFHISLSKKLYLYLVRKPIKTAHIKTAYKRSIFFYLCHVRMLPPNVLSTIWFDPWCTNIFIQMKLQKETASWSFKKNQNFCLFNTVNVTNQVFFQ